ncbi:unnamed protein product [Mytilus coruscus]|uniref:R3H domain-containing protein n=1 Tax=Mytilus coruscus TaxID=42192 RepID=A0A6J8AZ59_MYTCO|nr:unnamed protein product [Mytilus coruscus]
MSDERYLSPLEKKFIDNINTDLKKFILSGTKKSVLIFPPFDSFHRFLAHKCTEEYKELKSFSIGQGILRRLVICDQKDFIGESSNFGICMSNPRPSVGRGRARGRVKDGDSPGISPVGVRQSGITDSGHHIRKPDQLPSDFAADDLDQNRLRIQRSRGRGKKPEVQLYVPRGRRSQDSSNGNSQSQESQCLQSNSTECDQYNLPELKKQQGGTTDSNEKTDDIEKNLTSSDIKLVYMPPGRRREQEKDQSLSESSERGSDGDHWDVNNTDTTVRSESKEKYIMSDEFGERSHGIDLSSEVKCLDVDSSTVCLSGQKIKSHEEQGTAIYQEKSPREDQRIEFDNSVTFHSNDHQNVKQCSTINNDTHNIDTKVDKCGKNEEELAKDLSSFKNENTTFSMCKTSEHLNTDISLQPETNDNVHICENLDQSEHDTGDVSTKVHDKLDTVSSDSVREQIGSGNESCMNNLTNISDSIENNERLNHSNNHDNSGKVINSDLSDDLMTSDAALEQHEESDIVNLKDKGYNTNEGSEVREINNTISDASKAPFDNNVKTTTSNSDNDKSDLNMVNTEESQQIMASSDLSRINHDLLDSTEDDTQKVGNSSLTSQNSTLDLSKNIHEVYNIENVKSDDTILSSGSNRTEECISMSHDSGAITLESHPIQSGEATDSQDKTVLDACLKKESSDLRSEKDENSLQSNSNDESNHSKHKVSESGENGNSDLGSYKDSAYSAHTTKKSTDVKSNASEKPVKGENSRTNTEKGVKNSSKVIVRNDKLAAFGWELYTDKTNESTAEKERAESEEKDKKKSGKKKTGKGKNKLKKKQDSAAESKEINQQESETVVSEKKPIQSEEDESWDTMFDDDGESLDPNTSEEVGIFHSMFDDDGESLDPNTLEEVGIFHSMFDDDGESLDPNTLEESLDPNTLEEVGIFHSMFDDDGESLDPNTLEEVGIFHSMFDDDGESLDPNTLEEVGIFHSMFDDDGESLDPNTLEESLDPNTLEEVGIFHSMFDDDGESLDPNTLEEVEEVGIFHSMFDDDGESLDPNTSEEVGIFHSMFDDDGESLDPNTLEEVGIFHSMFDDDGESLDPNTLEEVGIFHSMFDDDGESLDPNTLEEVGIFHSMFDDDGESLDPNTLEEVCIFHSMFDDDGESLDPNTLEEVGIFHSMFDDDGESLDPNTLEESLDPNTLEEVCIFHSMFDDDGESLDPNTSEELSSNVGKVKVKKPVINYLNYQPKEPDLDYEGMNHVIEIYDFSSEMKTEDLLSAFSMFKSKGFDIKWVDDTHALGVFSSVIAANEALQFTHPLLKVGPLSLACRESKIKAKRAVGM